MAKGGKRKIGAGDVASNRQAAYRYELLDRLEAGMVLRGTEVKALRNGGATMKDAYATITPDGEIWLHNLHIPPYQPASRDNHPPERDRKLLLHRREIDRIVGRIKEKGWTLVPTRIYFSDGRAKVELALARGKDRFDKRESIKTREMKRDMDRQLRDVGR
jgi:SsrA-binding protein